MTSIEAECLYLLETDCKPLMQLTHLYTREGIEKGRRLRLYLFDQAYLDTRTIMRIHIIVGAYGKFNHKQRARKNDSSFHGKHKIHQAQGKDRKNTGIYIS